MLKAAGEVGIELLTELTEVVFCNGVIPTDWQESFILNLYKGKGDALERRNYRGLKLTDQVMKLHEHVLDSFIERLWTLTPCSLALCRFVAPLMLSSSFANCKRSTWLTTSHFTLPLLTWRRLSTEYPEKVFGGS